MAYNSYAGDKKGLMRHFIPNSTYGLEKFKKNFEALCENDGKSKSTARLN